MLAHAAVRVLEGLVPRRGADAYLAQRVAAQVLALLIVGDDLTLVLVEVSGGSPRVGFLGDATDRVDRVPCPLGPELRLLGRDVGLSVRRRAAVPIWVTKLVLACRRCLERDITRAAVALEQRAEVAHLAAPRIG